MRRKRPKLPRYRINRIVKWSLLAIALFFDGLQMISKILIFIGVGLVVEMALPAIISLLGYSTIWLMLLMRGVGIFKGKYMGRRFGISLTTMVLEAMPLFNLIPGITIWTYRMIALTRREDEEARAKIQKQIDEIEREEIRMQQMQSSMNYDVAR